MNFRRYPIGTQGALAALVAFAALTGPAAAADGPIRTVAGTNPGYSGDGGPATLAQLSNPRSIALSPAGTLLIADSGNGAVREIGIDGVIRDLTPGRQTAFAPTFGVNPVGIAYDAQNNPIIADPARDIVVRINRPSGQTGVTETLLAGTVATPGASGDGGPATSAGLRDPSGVAVLADGAILIADTGNNKIRRVSPSGQISTVAGTGTAGAGGDDAAATSARLSAPAGVTPVPEGGFLVADTGNHRIRRVSSSGTITTVAGGGGRGSGGDGGPATGAQLSAPASVATLRTGGLVIADTGNNRIRRVTPLGTIFTISGSTAGLSGDNGPMSAAQFRAPEAIVGTGTGGFIVADTGNARIRSLASDGVLPNPVGGRSLRISPVGGSPRATPAGQSASIALREPDVAQLGTRAATTAGQVKIETATADSGIRTATVTGGDFAIEQPQGPVETTFRLSSSLNGCRTSEGGPNLTASAAKKAKKKRKRRTRKIFVQSNGGHRTNGRYADAVVRGTQWSIQDYCTSTRVSVKEGSVRVRDRVKKRTVIVDAGERYVARRTSKTR